jgi:anti-anti-sigma factor
MLFQEIKNEIGNLRCVLGDATIKNVIVDFAMTDFFGSSALGMLLSVRKEVHVRGGRMALCNLSEHEVEILGVTKLDHLWPICTSRTEALRAVHSVQRQ